MKWWIWLIIIIVAILILRGAYIGATYVVNEQKCSAWHPENCDYFCETDSDCRPTMCGYCINSEQEFITCKKDYGFNPFGIKEAICMIPQECMYDGEKINCKCIDNSCNP